MIRLKKDNMIMGVCTEVQASAFVKNGWKRVVDEPVKAEPEPKAMQIQYSKTEINRMSTAELRELATEQGIEDADKKTGGELKKILIEKLGL